MEDELSGVTIKEFVGLNPRTYYFFILSLNSEYKYVLLKRKCLRHSIKRVQSKNHRIGTYEIKKIYLSCFDDEIYILNNGYDELALG